MKRALFALFILVLLAIPLSPAFAQGFVECGGSGQDPCGFCDIFKLINNIISFFLVPSSINGGFAVVPTIASLLVVVGGFYLMTGGGSPERLKQAKSIFTAVVIGIVIAYGAYLFLNLFFAFIGINVEWQGLQNWFQIQCNTVQ